MTILQKHLVFIPLFFVVMLALLGGLVMCLWNWLMPQVFDLPALSFWQAVGLLVLCRLLVGNMGFGGHHHHHGHGHCGCGNHNRIRENWANMTPEERQQIIEKHRGCDPEQTADEERR